jgi:hemerythrin superfamily protein
MNAIELLKRQHREVDQLFTQFERALDAPNSKHAIYELIADTLNAHSEIEEKIFYPAARYRKTEGLIERSYGDHSEVKQRVAEIFQFQPTQSEYDQKVLALKSEVQRHVREEEDQLFPKVSSQLGRLKLDQLGDEMAALEREIQARREQPEVGVEAQPASDERPAPME